MKIHDHEWEETGEVKEYATVPRAIMLKCVHCKAKAFKIGASSVIYRIPSSK
jgi:hypothetical protein